MSTSGNAPLSTSSRRRRGAALAAVALALAGGLAFAVVDTKAATTSLITPGDYQYHEHIAHAAPQEDTDTPRRRLKSGLKGEVGGIEKWLLIVIVVLGAVCLLCCVCCIIHVGTCGIL